MNDAALAAIILGPLVITYFLKSNAALGFLALCAGYALQSFVSSDIKSLLGKAGLSTVSLDTVNVLLLLVPLGITLLLCRGPSSRSFTKPKVLLNFLAALAAGGAFALMALPSFGEVGGTSLTDSSLWTPLAKAQSEIIGFGAVIALVLIWLNHHKGHSASKHHK